LLNLDEAINNFVDYEGYISIKDVATVAPPGHLPGNIDSAFREAAICRAVDCPNAAGRPLAMLTEFYIEALLVDEKAADQIWVNWAKSKNRD